MLFTNNERYCITQTRFDMILSNSMRFFVHSNAIRNLKWSLRHDSFAFCIFPVESIREDFRTLSFLLKKFISLPANSLWTFSKCSFNLPGFIFSGLSTLLLLRLLYFITHWGFSIFLSTIFVKPHCKNDSLYERFFPDVEAMSTRKIVKKYYKMLRIK